MLRTIMIFPQFNNIEIIDGIRDRYDPLAKLVRPHITLVFPFESEMLQGCMDYPEKRQIIRKSELVQEGGNNAFISLL